MVGLIFIVKNSTTGSSNSDGLKVGLNTFEEGQVWNYENTDLIFATNNDEKMRIEAGGNVGIGINNPTVPLDVVGDINTTTDYNIGGTQVLSSTTLGSGVINSSLTSVGTLTSLTTSGDINTSTDYNIGGTQVLSATTLGSGVVNSSLTNFGTLTSLDVSGDINTSTDYNIASTQVLSATTLGSGVINSSLTSNTGNLTNNGTLIVNTATQPQIVLRSTTSSGVNFYCQNSTTGSSNSDGLKLGINTLEEAQVWNNENTDLIFATNNDEKMRIENSGNVGIGINNPTSLLHIYENSTSTSSGLIIENDGTGDSILQFLLTGARRWIVGADNSDNDKFKIASDADLNTNAALTIDTNGNVGIGSTAPTVALDVVGDINTTTDYNIGGTQVLSATTLGSGVVNSSLTNFGTLTSIDNEWSCNWSRICSNTTY